MFYRPRNLSVVLLAIFAPVVAQSADILINGPCAPGTCTAPGLLNLGDSTSGTFSDIYTFADTDRYSITGSYSASYSGSTSISFNVAADYLGNATNTTSSADLLSVDLLQGYNFQGNPNGTYSFGTTLSQTDPIAGSYVQAQLFYDGHSIAILGPLFGLGSQSYSASTTFSTLTDPLNADFNYTFFFAAGTPAGVPEPAEAGLFTAGLAIVAIFSLRFRRSA